MCIAVSLGLIAALGAGCAKRQATYVAVDPNTGQQYAVVQQAQQQQQVATTTTYQQPVQYQSRGFELYGQGGVSAQAQAAPSSAPATTTDDIPNRGLFTSRRSAVPAPQMQQSYVVQYQAPAVAAAPTQTYVMQQPATVVQAPRAALSRQRRPARHLRHTGQGLRFGRALCRGRSVLLAR